LKKNGDTMHMLFPFKRVCASFVDLRPVGVISLRASSKGDDVETSDERGGWGEMRDILLGNVLENHIYEEEMVSRRFAET
jgi:hypothetical protein